MSWPAPALVAVALCTAGCSPVRVWHGRTPDRSRVVEVLEEGRLQYLRIDGVEGPRFSAVPAASLAFSADGKHVAYAAQEAAHWRVVANQTRGEPWQGIGPIVLSADGAHVAYAALSGKKWRVVHDGKVGPALDSLFEGTLLFSADGERLAYIAEQAGKSHAAVDGQLGPAQLAIGEFGFSPDGAHFAYIARDEAAAWVVRDRVEGARYDTVRRLVQGGGARVGAVARRGAQRFALIDGVEGAPHRSVEAIVFSNDGGRVAYVARDDERSAVIVDGAAGPPFERIEALAFSADGAHLVYLARSGTSQQVVRDGEPGPAFGRVSALSQAGRARWAYLGWDKRGAWPVVDGEKQPVEPWAADLVLGSDGRRFAFLARRAQTFEVVHDAGRAQFDLVVEGSLSFSGDGRRWGCLAGDAARKKLFVAIEGGKSVPFDLDELAGLAADRPIADPELLRRWVRAEVERAGADLLP